MTRPRDPDLVTGDDGTPRSALFGDVYFSVENGLEESRAVFLQGCGLPGLWAGRSRFGVGELGFGTGLNVLALFDLWRRTRPAGGRLHVFSVEGYPMTAEAAARALSAFPEIADLTAMLVARWPRRVEGVHRLDFPELDATLDLAIGEALPAVRAWSGRADAWFLDGFSPASNPGMWSPELLAAVFERSAPGARVGTFTVAGAVRRALAEAGFEVAKRPGFGRKRERLEAVRPGEPPAARALRVAVIGAGIAGAALTRALGRLGLRPIVVEAEKTGAGASGNPAGLVTPRLDAGGGAVARLSAQAFYRAVDVYGRETPQAVIARGVVQLEAMDRDARRFDALADQPLFEPGALTRLTPLDAAARLGEPVERGGLWMAEALTVENPAVLDAFLADADLRTGRVARVAPHGTAWRLMDAKGAPLAEADAVIVAAGAGLSALVDLPLQPVRGQAEVVRGGGVAAPAAFGGYAVPTRDGVLFGATHDRDDDRADVRERDRARNLDTLAAVLPALASALADTPSTARAGVRATTRDRLPVAGRLAEGLFVLGGMGSRGLTFAPLLAEHVAALVADAPSPLPDDLARLMAPERLTPA